MSEAGRTNCTAKGAVQESRHPCWHAEGTPKNKYACCTRSLKCKVWPELTCPARIPASERHRRKAACDAAPAQVAADDGDRRQAGAAIQVLGTRSQKTRALHPSSAPCPLPTTRQEPA